MGFLQVAAILLLTSSAIGLPLEGPVIIQDTVQPPRAPDVPQSTNIGTTITRGKRGYLNTAIAYPPLLTSAIAPAVPVVAPVLTTYSYLGHYGKPAIYPPLYPHGYHGLSYYG